MPPGAWAGEEIQRALCLADVFEAQVEVSLGAVEGRMTEDALSRMEIHPVFEGVVLQPMRSGGLEAIVGVTQDPVKVRASKRSLNQG